jgi:multimeric flavodoxin WrbA
MSNSSKQLLVVYHSASGNTQRMADAVVAGLAAMSSPDFSYLFKTALDAGPEDVLACDGIILLTPENFGYMSGALKYFFDRIYYPCLDQTQGLPYALIIRAGNDGTGAEQSIERIITGLAWRAIAEPIVSKGEFDASILPDCRELAESFAVGLQSGIF